MATKFGEWCDRKQLIPTMENADKFAAEQRTSDYRRCRNCLALFSPITSDADNRYTYCSPECERV